jgi:hypothetical protein
MTLGDATMERGAQGLQRLSRRAAMRGGLVGKLAEPLAEDAVLFRRMKPSLVVARVKGDAPTNLEPGQDAVVPSGPQLGKRPKKRGGPNPFLVLGVAFAVGVVAAKLIDWRGHAHPSD